MIKEQWEQAFEDWERLLKVAGAEDLLDDPKAIWDEAWRQAQMVNIPMEFYNERVEKKTGGKNEETKTS